MLAAVPVAAVEAVLYVGWLYEVVSAPLLTVVSRGVCPQFLLACASCLVRCVERMMEYFNHWAFVQVALYGKDFRTAGGDAIRVFKERGWTLIINDNLIDRALTLGCIMVGCVTGLVGAGWAVSMVDDGGWVFAGAFLSFLVRAMASPSCVCVASTYPCACAGGLRHVHDCYQRHRQRGRHCICVLCRASRCAGSNPPGSARCSGWSVAAVPSAGVLRRRL